MNRVCGLLLWLWSSAAAASARDVALAARPNVVKISASFAGEETRRGFGYVVGGREGELYVVTANHVVRDPERARTVQVEFFSDQGVLHRATLLGNFRSKPTDLAVLKVQKPAPVSLVELCTDPAGIAVGTPAAYVGREGRWFVPATEGAVNSAQANEVGTFEVDFSRSAEAKEGTSGAPLFSAKGLMGMVIEDSNLGVATVLSVEALIKLFDAASWNYPWSAASCRADDDPSARSPRGPQPDLPGAAPASRGGHLFLRADMAFGYLAFAGHLRANANFGEIDMSSNGASIAIGIAGGIFVRDDLVLAASIWNAYAVSPSLSPPPPAQDAKLSLIALGPQLTYYVLPSDVSLSGMAGLCGAYLNSDTGEVHLNKLLGLGARVSLAKEWAIGDRWAGGVAGQVAYSYSPGEDSGRPTHLSTWLFGLGVIATYR